MCYDAWRNLTHTAAKEQILQSAKLKVEKAFEEDFKKKLLSNIWEDHSQSRWDAKLNKSFCKSIAVRLID